MPFQITFVINARQYLRKLLTKADNRKNEVTDKKKHDSTTLEQSIYLQYDKNIGNQYLYDLNVSTDDERNRTDEEMSQKGQEKHPTKSKGYFKKLFSKKQSTNTNECKVSEVNSKKSLNSKDSFKEKPQNKCEVIINGDNSADETFNAILNAGDSLSTLIGKEFTLTTPVTVQAVENMESSEPNILLKGIIPFKYLTADGIRKKKVYVSGRICKHSLKSSSSSLTKEHSYRSIAGSSGPRSLTKIDIDKPQESLKFPVNWKTAHIFQKQDYIVHCGLLSKGNDVSKDKRKSEKQIKDEKALANTEVESEEEPLADVPITSITITRSRTRFITYNDGTEYIEKCGKETVTIKAPKGMYFNEEAINETCEENNKRVTQTETLMLEQSPEAKALNTDYTRTRDAYFFVRNGNSGLFPYDIFEQEYNVLRNAFAKNKLKLGSTSEKVLYNSNKAPYPRQDYTAILEDKYNPLTWLYKSYNKTKNFVRGFSVRE